VEIASLSLASATSKRGSEEEMIEDNGYERAGEKTKVH